MLVQPFFNWLFSAKTTSGLIPFNIYLWISQNVLANEIVYVVDCG